MDHFFNHLEMIYKKMVMFPSNKKKQGLIEQLPHTDRHLPSTLIPKILSATRRPCGVFCCSENGEKTQKTRYNMTFNNIANSMVNNIVLI